MYVKFVVSLTQKFEKSFVNTTKKIILKKIITMGRKLSSWEKSQRAREKERERAASRAATAKRRASERLKKEKIAKAKEDLGELKSELFDHIIAGLINYSGYIIQSKEKFPSAKNMEYPQTISFKDQEDLKIPKIPYSISKNSFVHNKALESLKRNMNMDYETFKNKHGSFFGNLFGKTKKYHQSFTAEASIKHKEISSKEKKRIDDFENALVEYQKEIDAFQKQINLKGADDNKDRKNIIKKIQSEIDIYNSSLTNLKNEIDKTLNSFNSPLFYDLFCTGLPLNFDLVDENVKSLKSGINELDSDFYDNPKNNFKFSISTESSVPQLLIIYEEDYFPLPSKQQVNPVKAGVSIRPLIKKTINEIEENIIPNMALYYVNYAFNSISNADNILLSIGKIGHDKATGKEEIEWEKNLKFERDKFNDINFTKILSSETLSIFETNDKIKIPKNIKWVSSKSRDKNIFLDKLKKIKLSEEDLFQRMSLIKSQKFSLPVKNKSLKDAEYKLKKIGGIKK
jgi:hypothetical protein